MSVEHNSRHRGSHLLETPLDEWHSNVKQHTNVTVTAECKYLIFKFQWWDCQRKEKKQDKNVQQWVACLVLWVSLWRKTAQEVLQGPPWDWYTAEFNRQFYQKTNLIIKSRTPQHPMINWNSNCNLDSAQIHLCVRQRCMSVHVYTKLKCTSFNKTLVIKSLK